MKATVGQESQVFEQRLQGNQHTGQGNVGAYATCGAVKGREGVIASPSAPPRMKFMLTQVLLGLELVALFERNCKADLVS